MSRGLGSVQRAVLAGLANGPCTIEKLAGGIEAGGSYRSTRWESFRRAVASLRRAGLVIEHAKIYGTSPQSLTLIRSEAIDIIIGTSAPSRCALLGQHLMTTILSPTFSERCRIASRCSGE